MSPNGGERSGDPLPDTLPSALSKHEGSLRARGLSGVDLYSDLLERPAHRRATHCQTATPFRAIAKGRRSESNCSPCIFKHTRYTTQAKNVVSHAH